MEQQLERQWRKATYSGNGGGDCITVANSTRAVLVRDSKELAGGTLSFPANAWANFTARLKAER